MSIAVSLFFVTLAAAQAADDVPVSGDVGVEWVNAYFFRGVVYEDAGIILQPYNDLSLRLFARRGLVEGLRFNLGFWGSLNSLHPDAQYAPHPLNEVDVAPSLHLDLAGGWSSELRYTAFLSPNGSFEGSHELLFALRREGEAGRLRWKEELVLANPTYTTASRYTYGGLGGRVTVELVASGEWSTAVYLPLRAGFTLAGTEEAGQEGFHPRFGQAGLGISEGRTGENGGFELYAQVDGAYVVAPLREALGQEPWIPLTTVGWARWF